MTIYVSFLFKHTARGIGTRVCWLVDRIGITIFGGIVQDPTYYSD